MSRWGGAAAMCLTGAAVALAAPKYSHFFYGAVPVQLSDALVGAAALCLLGHVVGSRRLQRSWLYVGFALYLFAAALSLTQVDSVWRGAVKIVGICSLMAAPTVAINAVRSPELWRRLHLAWLLAAATAGALTCLAVVGFYLGLRDAESNPMLGNYGSLPPGRIPRMEGPFLNSNQFCNYLAVTLCLWAARLPELRRRHGVTVTALLAAPVALALPFTLSPNLGPTALSVAVFFVMARVGPVWMRSVAVACCGLAVAVFAVATAFIILPTGEGIPLGPFGVLSSIPSGRVAASLAALDTISQHPLIGAGVGEPVAHFHHEFANQGGPAHIKDFHLEAHNFYLGLWAQMGPLALLGFLIVVGTVLRGVLKLTNGDDSSRYLRAGLAAALIGQLLYGGLFGGFEDSRHIWMMLAVAAAAGLNFQREAEGARASASDEAQAAVTGPPADGSLGAPASGAARLRG